MFEKSELFSKIREFVTVRYESVDTAEDLVWHGIKHGEYVNIDGGNNAWVGSDYGGSLYYRANANALVRDYPQFLSLTTYHYSGYGLDLDVAEFFKPSNRDAANDLADTLGTLANDYPVYDEDSVSEVEQEATEQMWDGWLQSDLQSTVFEHYGIEVDLDDAFSAILEIYSEDGVYPEQEGHADMTIHGWADHKHTRNVVIWALENHKINWDPEDINAQGINIVRAWAARPIPGQLAAF